MAVEPKRRHGDADSCRDKQVSSTDLKMAMIKTAAVDGRYHEGTEVWDLELAGVTVSGEHCGGSGAGCFINVVRRMRKNKQHFVRVEARRRPARYAPRIIACRDHEIELLDPQRVGFAAKRGYILLSQDVGNAFLVNPQVMIAQRGNRRHPSKWSDDCFEERQSSGESDEIAGQEHQIRIHVCDSVHDVEEVLCRQVFRHMEVAQVRYAEGAWRGQTDVVVRNAEVYGCDGPQERDGFVRGFDRRRAAGSESYADAAGFSSGCCGEDKSRQDPSCRFWQ